MKPRALPGASPGAEATGDRPPCARAAPAEIFKVPQGTFSVRREPAGRVPSGRGSITVSGG
jgi:hypothetical protein